MVREYVEYFHVLLTSFLSIFCFTKQHASYRLCIWACLRGDWFKTHNFFRSLLLPGMWYHGFRTKEIFFMRKCLYCFCPFACTPKRTHMVQLVSVLSFSCLSLLTPAKLMAVWSKGDCLWLSRLELLGVRYCLFREALNCANAAAVVAFLILGTL